MSWQKKTSICRSLSSRNTSALSRRIISSSTVRCLKTSVSAIRARRTSRSAAAARAAQCEEFIEKLPQGYDTPAGEAGKRLSGGEKQRIAIARMMLKNAPIVILDEATAFTDPENEDKLQRSIAALTKGKTLLVIAHRLSTIKNADNIVVLKNGAIEVAGTQEELLASCPLYKDMWLAHIGAQNWAVSAAEKEA